MQENYLIIFSLVLAYLTGSIPTAIWVGKVFYRIDIRNHGSGNAGATNTMRVLGVRTGIPVLLFDIFKGWLAVKYAIILNVLPQESSSFINLSIALGVMAVIGHIFPVYAGFRGGKGVASIFGVLLALSPFATLCAGGIFIISLIISRYVSVSSMLAGISFPVWIIWVFKTEFLSLKIFAVVVAILLIITHRKNINRLFLGKENKAEFLFQKGKNKK
jgi:glycerol-3-phosphate acyltransferase PlsY